MNFRLIFVLDLLDGVVVHAKRGEREQYAPVHLFSSIVGSSDPVRIMEKLKPADVYIADLNRLMGTGSNKGIIKEIRDNNRKARIMVDYGVKTADDLEEAADAEIADSIILGTETASMELIGEVSKNDNLDISISVDIFNKQVLTKDKHVKTDPLLLIHELNEYRGVRDVIVLELDRVGTKSGIDFNFLARAVDVSEHNILCGGGVSGCEDVDKMQGIGVKGALVATAVHDGSIPVPLLRLRTK
ncbi:phosphoribosylformimino-5-aminoimidazole carboxamide ribotide isomerase [ANME-1 cluster archaeon GoMg1]|nr:phosphoribosylformimino-5-aminoimidazole carboxamide ribotide isomerase [ANME-1 cluster archaeon GoMg1]